MNFLSSSFFWSRYFAVAPVSYTHLDVYKRQVDASTVGIVSDVDEDFGTLTVISGDVDGKVADCLLYTSSSMIRTAQSRYPPVV